MYIIRFSVLSKAERYRTGPRNHPACKGEPQKMSEEAVLASQAAICVAQFMKESSHKEKLKKLGELNSWKRAEFIEKGAWDIMPGQEKAGYLVSRACADGLELLIEK